MGPLKKPGNRLKAVMLSGCKPVAIPLIPRVTTKRPGTGFPFQGVLWAKTGDQQLLLSGLTVSVTLPSLWVTE